MTTGTKITRLHNPVITGFRVNNTRISTSSIITIKPFADGNGIRTSRFFIRTAWDTFKLVGGSHAGGTKRDWFLFSRRDNHWYSFNSAVAAIRFIDCM